MGGRRGSRRRRLVLDSLGTSRSQWCGTHFEAVKACVQWRGVLSKGYLEEIKVKVDQDGVHKANLENGGDDV